MGISGRAEGDEEGGASGSGYFGHRDRARAADDQICLGKALRHILDEGHYLRSEFAPRVRHANSIIVAFTGLVHDEKLVFSRCQQIERINYRAIDGQRAAAAAGNKDTEGLAMLAARRRKKFSAHRNASGDSLGTKTGGGFLESAGDARGNSGEDAVGKSWLDVRLENHRRNAVQTRREDHWAGRIASDPKRRAGGVA